MVSAACRSRAAESRASDAEIEIEGLESKVASLTQLLQSEQAAAAANSIALEQSWSSRMTDAVSAAAAEARAAAETEAESQAAVVQQQLGDAELGRQVCLKAVSPCMLVCN